MTTIRMEPQTSVPASGMVDVASTLDHDFKGPQGPMHRNNKEKSQRRNFSVYDPAVGYHFTAVEVILPPGEGSPRHHHNFDQIRMTLSGTTQYDQQRVGAGDLQYIPESTDYGPQIRDETSPRQFTFQFPGQSGFPIIEHAAGPKLTRALIDQGVIFKDGFVTFPDGRKQDSAEAMWEHLFQRKIEYAPRRCPQAIYFHTENYAWEPTEVPGIFVKHLGRFNTYGPSFGFLKLDPGAVTPSKLVGWIQFRVVTEGEVECAGKVCPEGSRIYDGPGSTSQPIRSKTGATLLTMQVGYRGKTDPAPMTLL